MLESSTNGAGAAVEAADGRAAPEGVPGPGEVPNPELVEQATRRKFTAKYKLEILEKADACTEPGQIGELPATRDQDLEREVGSCSASSNRKRRAHPVAGS